MADTELRARPARPLLPRLLRWAGALVGLAILAAGLRLSVLAAGSAAEFAGLTGKTGHLAVTDCRPHSAGGSGGLTYICRGDFTSSDGGFHAADIRLLGGKDHAVGTVVAARYADGAARQTGTDLALFSLIPVLVGVGFAALGGTLVFVCLRRRARPRGGSVWPHNRVGPGPLSG